MSSEVCPFCGKSFKRLKSHLPHCKSAKSSKISPQHEETKAPSSSPLGHNLSPITVKTETLTKKTNPKPVKKIKMAAESSTSSTSVGSLPPSSSLKSKQKISSAKSQPTLATIMTDYLPKQNDEVMDFEAILKLKTKKSKVRKKNLDDSQSAKKTAIKMEGVLTNKPSSEEDKGAAETSKDDFWMTDEMIDKNLSENKWNSKGKAKIMLHDVRSSLGRTKQNGHQRNHSVSHELPTKYEKALVSLQQQAPSQLTVLSPEKNQLLLLKNGDFMDQLSKMENKECSFTQRADDLKAGLRMDGHSMGLAALSSPARTFLEAEVSAKAFSKDVPLLKPLKEERKQNGGQSSTRGGLSQQRLGQVMLREFPDWLVSRSPRRPRDALEMLHRGWQWYYRRYIDVKKGGVGGVTMLLAGYCVLSYIWAYPHLKRERWRKYH